MWGCGPRTETYHVISIRNSHFLALYTLQCGSFRTCGVNGEIRGNTQVGGEGLNFIKLEFEEEKKREKKSKKKGKGRTKLQKSKGTRQDE